MKHCFSLFFFRTYKNSLKLEFTTKKQLCESKVADILFQGFYWVRKRWTVHQKFELFPGLPLDHNLKFQKIFIEPHIVILISGISYVLWKYAADKCSVMSDSLQPHGLLPSRLLCPWDFPGKNTAVGCHFLLQGIFPTQGSNPGLPYCSYSVDIKYYVKTIFKTFQELWKKLWCDLSI